MAKLINDPGALVQQAIDGVLLHNQHLSRLDGYPDIKVVFDRNHDKSKVAVISGGGSGHEPAHAGYVGQGMLTAAVCGEVFASPSAEAVLAAIKTVGGAAGVLLIVKNYTGDRLHFGIAAERAKSEAGIPVEMVVVGEDVAIDSPGLAGRRGLAGTVLVHKIAGAAAAAGASLSKVVEAAQRAADAMATLGCALRVCTLPGKQPSDRLPEGRMELGLGIHGEPGHQQMPVLGAAELTALMLQHISSSPFFQLQQGEDVALMVNNLGATTPLEVSCVVQEAVKYLRGTLQVKVSRCWVGHFMTSLDMAGVSLTLLRLPRDQATAQEVLSALDAPVGAPGWPHASGIITDAPPVALPAGLHGGESAPAAGSATGPISVAAVRAAAEALVAGAQSLNELDAKVGDGDCGDTVSHGGNAILRDLASGTIPTSDAASALSAIARSVRGAVGGTSGALYDVGLTAAAGALRESSSASGGPAGVGQWAAALRAGAAAVMKYGGAREGCRTMLDALLPAAAALEGAAQTGVNAKEAAAVAAAAAAAGAEATRNMAAAAGRASYVPTSVAGGIPDPGALAVSMLLGAVAGALAS